MAQFLLDTTGLTGGASCWTLNRNCLARCWEATGLPRGSSRWLLFIRRRAASVKKPRGKPVASSEAKAKLFVATHRDYHGTSPWHLKTPRTPRGISKHPGLPVAYQSTRDSVAAFRVSSPYLNYCGHSRLLRGVIGPKRS